MKTLMMILPLSALAGCITGPTTPTKVSDDAVATMWTTVSADQVTRCIGQVLNVAPAPEMASAAGSRYRIDTLDMSKSAYTTRVTVLGLTTDDPADDAVTKCLSATRKAV